MRARLARPHFGRTLRGVTGRVVVGIAAAGAALVLLGGSVAAGASPNGSATGLRKLTRTFAGIERSSVYRQSDWGYEVLDQNTGKVLA
jgi:hypothetical protein